MDRLVVLGGSSPFTAALVDALEGAAGTLAPRELVLCGRNAESLYLVSRYGARRLGPLGWRVAGLTEPERALEGASLVLHQVRYGGMQGRADDEAAALRFGIPADETLGPAALRSLLRVAPGVRQTARLFVKLCPDAWVLNLTNPLSVATASLVEEGVARCVGLCELPLVTAREAAAALGIPFVEIDWAYAGLNHRGFIFELKHEGRDVIPDLAERLRAAQAQPGVLGTREIGGVGAESIARLHAVPTKYYRLLESSVVGRRTAPERHECRPAGGDHRKEHDVPGPARAGRAAQLTSLRERILEELRASEDASPPTLRERYMLWYPLSVVPMIAALSSRTESRHVVNVMGTDGLVREVHALVCRDGIRPTPRPVPSGEVARWLERFERHERSMLAVARSPDPVSVRRALEADPLVPEEAAGAIASAMWGSTSA